MYFECKFSNNCNERPKRGKKKQLRKKVFNQKKKNKIRKKIITELFYSCFGVRVLIDQCHVGCQDNAF